MTLPQQKLPFVSVQLRPQPALPSPLDDLQSIIQQIHRLLDLPCDLVRPRQKADLIGYPRLCSDGAVRCQTPLQPRYPLRDVACINPDPSAKDNPRCAP